MSDKTNLRRKRRITRLIIIKRVNRFVQNMIPELPEYIIHDGDNKFMINPDITNQKANGYRKKVRIISNELDDKNEDNNYWIDTMTSLIWSDIIDIKYVHDHLCRNMYMYNDKCNDIYHDEYRLNIRLCGTKNNKLWFTIIPDVIERCNSYIYDMFTFSPNLLDDIHSSDLPDTVHEEILDDYNYFYVDISKSLKFGLTNNLLLDKITIVQYVISHMVDSDILVSDVALNIMKTFFMII